MNFLFSMVIACVVLTVGAGVSRALAADGQIPPPAGQPPVAQPPSTPPSTTQPSAPQPSTTPPSIEPSRTPPADMGQRQTVEGVVQSVAGSMMTVKSRTGQTIVVDLSKVSEKVYQIAAEGETVTVIGVIAPGSDRLTAQAVIGNIKHERESPAALPRDAQKPLRLGAQAPVSEEDCQDGGWALYGFRTQGQCVSAVQPVR